MEVSGCGVVAAVADGGFITAAQVDNRHQNPPCGGDLAIFGTCGPEPVRFDGRGDVLLRRYLAPGLTAGDVTAAGVEPDVLLAHAEAQVLLGAIGYQPTDELVRESLGSIPAGHYHSARPPVTPDEGCVFWVGVARGLGRASTTWSGPTGSGFMPANVSIDTAENVSVFGLFACGSDSGAVQSNGEAAMYSQNAGDAEIIYRAYQVASSAFPTLEAAPASATIGRAKTVAPGDVVLPNTVPFILPEEN